jgi:hypothetical protein
LAIFGLDQTTPTKSPTWPNGASTLTFYAKKEQDGETLERDWQTFNCQAVRLSFQDLQDLENAVKEENLPYTQGFFFGESDPEHKKETLKFIVKARKAIAQDMEIYYDSWW